MRGGNNKKKAMSLRTKRVSEEEMSACDFLLWGYTSSKERDPFWFVRWKGWAWGEPHLARPSAGLHVTGCHWDTGMLFFSH